MFLILWKQLLENCFIKQRIKMALLTKSKYMAGLSCPKYLWMMFHDMDKIPEKDIATEYVIQQGHIVGQLAKKWVVSY